RGCYRNRAKGDILIELPGGHSHGVPTGPAVPLDEPPVPCDFATFWYSIRQRRGRRPCSLIF
ncbi:MAG: hypothetical protein KGR98_00135, partial [Verrucomicrobia bacterium]|nr:hypothetical protein [Verrucomicrobiota bacterium]